MFVGNLPAISNKASWIMDLEIVDDETGDLVDISTLTITLEVRDPLTDISSLTATNGDGITVTGTGTFQLRFTKDDVGTLCARTYQVGVTLADDEDTTQLVIGNLPVLNGIMS